MTNPKSRKRVVTHFGIHWDDNNIAWLLQGRGSTNAIGLKGLPPFDVRCESRSNTHCGHQVPMSVPVPHMEHMTFVKPMFGDPLFEAMLPFPKYDGEDVFFIEQEPRTVDILRQLSTMASPVVPLVRPMWGIDVDKTIELLQGTNVAPLVLFDAKPEDSAKIEKLAKAAVLSPRKLIISGDKYVVLPKFVHRIETELGDKDEEWTFEKLQVLPWEALGALFIRMFMQRKLPYNPELGSHDFEPPTPRKDRERKPPSVSSKRSNFSH